MFGLSELFGQKPTTVDLLEDVFKEMTTITGNETYINFTRKKDFKFCVKDLQTVFWVNSIAQGLPRTIPTALELRYKKIMFIGDAILRFEANIFEWSHDFIRTKNFGDAYYQRLLSRANPKKAVELCDKFLRQAYEENPNSFKLCPRKKPYFMP